MMSRFTMATEAMDTDAASIISTHGKFNATDADVTIQASDDVQFRLHRKHLDAYTGAFPGAESAALIRSDGQGDVVHLTEPAEILEILFEFVYPRRHPDLNRVDFKILAPLAEAVEKYEVFAAMRMCEVRLRPFIPDAPMTILLHGMKHDYPQLVDEAALQLSRTRMSLDDILEKLPSKAQMPWVRYHEAWRAIFTMEPTMNKIRMCVNCKAATMVWITDLLERAPTIDGLKSQLSAGPPENYKYIFNQCTGLTGPIGRVGKGFGFQSCVKLGIRAVLVNAVVSVPPFTSFLKDSQAAKHAAKIGRESAF